ncbi:hypothetical protein NVIRPANT_00900 [Pantoea sp. Nvir]|nr:hypothetical protein NVIRPANT_00900 [Pantoea sp. Nvir]
MQKKSELNFNFTTFLQSLEKRLSVFEYGIQLTQNNQHILKHIKLHVHILFRKDKSADISTFKMGKS